MKAYGHAWETQDSDAIVALFNKTGTYQVTPFEKAYRNHKGIRLYWDTVVKANEKGIKFKLLNTWVSGTQGFAEWRSKFYHKEKAAHVELGGIILVEIKSGKIQRLWEYWMEEIKK